MSTHDGKWSLVNPDEEVCCRCGAETHDPIFVRAAWEDYHPGEYKEDA